MARRQPAADPSTRAEALRLADKFGASEAAKRLGISANTIRSWRHRSGEAGPPKGVDLQSWIERKQAAAEDAWETAQKALAQVRSLLAEGKTADAQRAALTMAILIDKSGVLEEAARREQVRQVRIAEGHASLVAEIICIYFGASACRLVRRRGRRSLVCCYRPERALHCRRQRTQRKPGVKSASRWRCS